MKMDVTKAEQYVREFAETFPSANVLASLTLCEAGILSWEAVAELFNASLRDALVAIVAQAN